MEGEADRICLPFLFIRYFLTTGAQPQLQPQLLCDLGVACAFCAGFFLSEAVMVITSFLFKFLAINLYSC